MRITGFRATPVAVPFREDELWAFGGRRGLVSILLEVDTDEGVTGVGEASAYPSADIVLAVLRSVEPLVVGEDPFAIERISKRINVIGTWHHVKATSPGIAAVEMACWDIVGKVCGQPLVNLFGGRVRDRVEFFYYLSRRSPSEVAADAVRGAKAGFRTFYLKVGSDDPRDDIERVQAIRDGAGADALIRVDANEAWSPGAAVRIITEMERFGLELVEQPVSGRNLPEMAYVRGKIATPLLANEASWTRYDQLDVIRHSAADVISVDNQMDGGLLNMKRSAGLCEVAGLPVLKHSLGELGVAVYASVHLMAATPNFLPASQSYASFLADDVIAGASPLPYVDGSLAVPDAPGIGVELDADRVARYAELYEREGAAFAFHEPAALTATPVLPKL
jgi:L-alanine-DL-glutamate epimerase-like enolase superfamily enzyme